MEQPALEQVLGSPVRLTLDEIVNHPRLPEARKVYLDRFLAVFDGDPFLVRLLLDSGRFFVFHSAAILEASQDPARRETWFTLARLKQETALFGFASDRHVDQLVSRLCVVGFLERHPAPGDRRVRLLATTPRLREHHSAWLASHFAPLAELYPHHDYGPVLRHDRDFHTLYCRTCLPFTPIGARVMATLTDILLFFHHAAGPLIMSALLQAAMKAGDQRAGVPYNDTADRFGVSRTHVRRLLQEAEAAGLVRLIDRGGRRVEILPRLWASHDHGLAVGMYLNDAVNLAAMRVWRAEQPAGSTSQGVGAA